MGGELQGRWDAIENLDHGSTNNNLRNKSM